MDNEPSSEMGTHSAAADSDGRKCHPRRGFARFILDTLFAVLLRPNEIFGRRAFDANAGSAISFYVTLTAFALALRIGVLTATARMAAPTSRFVAAKVAAALSAPAIAAAMLHGMCWVGRLGEGRFRRTLIASLYVIGGLNVVAWVPYVGFPVAAIWGSYLFGLALQYARGASGLRATITVLMTLPLFASVMLTLDYALLSLLARFG